MRAYIFVLLFCYVQLCNFCFHASLGDASVILPARERVCLQLSETHSHTLAHRHTHTQHTLHSTCCRNTQLFYSSRWNAKVCGSGWAENKPATGRGLLLPHYTNFKVAFLMQLLLPPLLLHSRCFSRCSVLFFLFYGSWRCRTTCNYYGALAWLMNYYVYATRQSRQAAERKVNCNCNCNSKLSLSLSTWRCNYNEMAH